MHGGTGSWSGCRERSFTKTGGSCFGVDTSVDAISCRRLWHPSSSFATSSEPTRATVPRDEHPPRSSGVLSACNATRRAEVSTRFRSWRVHHRISSAARQRHAATLNYRRLEPIEYLLLLSVRSFPADFLALRTHHPCPEAATCVSFHPSAWASFRSSAFEAISPAEEAVP